MANSSIVETKEEKPKPGLPKENTGNAGAKVSNQPSIFWMRTRNMMNYIENYNFIANSEKEASDMAREFCSLTGATLVFIKPFLFPLSDKLDTLRNARTNS